jgi:hypothetical protein
MNTLNKVSAAIVLSLGLAATASAHPMGGNAGQGMGPGAGHGGQHQGMQGGMGHGMGHGGMNHGMGGGMKHGAAQGGHGDAHGQGPRGPQTGQSLLTPEERTALRDRMRNAKSPEERQQIALANRAEMEKRAADKGIALPEHRGPRGQGSGPAAGEHKH